MVTFKREVKLWKQANPMQRALMFRNDADMCWLAIEMQHARITGFDPATNDVLTLVRQRNDVYFFFMALHNLLLVAELAGELSDPRTVMPAALDAFTQRAAGVMLTRANEPATITKVRNALEHFQNLETRGGLGFGRGGDRWYVNYRDRSFDTHELVDAAHDLHRAIREAVDSEAFMDFHGDHPTVELRDPSDIVRPWRPGLDIMARQAAAMQQLSSAPPHA